MIIIMLIIITTIIIKCSWMPQMQSYIKLLLTYTMLRRTRRRRRKMLTITIWNVNHSHRQKSYCCNLSISTHNNFGNTNPNITTNVPKSNVNKHCINVPGMKKQWKWCNVNIYMHVCIQYKCASTYACSQM